METLHASVSQEIRHLALIDMKGCTYQQLPLTNSHFFKVVEKHAQKRSKHETQTEVEYIHAAQQRIYNRGINPDNAYASICFLGMQRGDAQAVRAATEKIVDDFLRLMHDADLAHMWGQTWHPHRFAAVATFCIPSRC